MTVRFKNNTSKYQLRRLKLLKCFNNEWLTSTTHGIPYIANNQLYYLERIFWVTSFFACTSVMVVLLSMQYFRFITAPIVVSVEMDYFDWNISYPAITLCPLYKPDVLRFGILVNNTYGLMGINLEAFLWAVSQSAFDTLEYMDLNLPEDVLQLINPRDYARVAATMFRDFERELLTINTNWPISVDGAMTEMGMCHVINSNVATFDKPHKWNATAAAYIKNNIELSVFEADFFTQITNYASIYKIFIHSPDEVTVSTGSSFVFDVEGFISLGLTVWSTRISDDLRNQPLWLRKCRFINEPISKRYPIYSFNHCILECRIKMIQRICGCTPHFYKPLSHERICYINELKCVLKYRKEMITLETSKEIYQKFSKTKDLPKISRDCGCLSSCEFDLYYKHDEDFVPKKGVNKLKIKITSFPKVRVVRDIIFNFYDIVLRSGGVMNLCLGSSIISLIELILSTMKITLCILIEQFISIAIFFKEFLIQLQIKNNNN